MSTYTRNSMQLLLQIGMRLDRGLEDSHSNFSSSAVLGVWPATKNLEAAFKAGSSGNHSNVKHNTNDDDNKTITITATTTTTMTITTITTITITVTITITAITMTTKR